MASGCSKLLVDIAAGSEVGLSEPTVAPKRGPVFLRGPGGLGFSVTQRPCGTECWPPSHHSSFFSAHHGLCPRRLTCLDSVNRVPHPLAPG